MYIILLHLYCQVTLPVENTHLFNIFGFSYSTIHYCREEREVYYRHRQKAKTNPKQNVCLIVDGMDQMKLLIPQLLNTMKIYSSAWRLKTHLTGVLKHLVILT